MSANLPSKVWMVVVCGHRYANAVFTNEKSATAYATFLNNTPHLKSDQGLWVAVEATLCDSWYDE